MRLEINTSGSWKILGDVEHDRADQVRDACALLVNLSRPKCVAFRLVGELCGEMMRLDHIGPRGIVPAEWDSRRKQREAERLGSIAAGVMAGRQ